VVHDIEVSN